MRHMPTAVNDLELTYDQENIGGNRRMVDSATLSSGSSIVFFNPADVTHRPALILVIP
jgi:hypothetical protein